MPSVNANMRPPTYRQWADVFNIVQSPSSSSVCLQSGLRFCPLCLRCTRRGIFSLWLVIFEHESQVLEVIGRHEVPKYGETLDQYSILQAPAISALLSLEGVIAHVLHSGIGCTYLSIRQVRYSLASLRHASSLVPRLDLMHFK
jgi:hypothetical protein